MNNKERITRGEIIFTDCKKEVKDFVEATYNNVRVVVAQCYVDDKSDDTTYLIAIDNNNVDSHQVINLIPDSLKMLFGCIGSACFNENIQDWLIETEKKGLKIEGSYSVDNEIPNV